MCSFKHLIFTCLFSIVLVICGRIKVDPLVPLTETAYHQVGEKGNGFSSNDIFFPLNNLNNVVDQKESALVFIKNKFPQFSFTIANEIKTKHSGVYHLYLKQSIEDIPVFNGDFAIHVDRNGDIISYSENIYKCTDKLIAAAATEDEIDEKQAFNLFIEYINQFKAEKNSSNILDTPINEEQSKGFKSVRKGWIIDDGMLIPGWNIESTIGKNLNETENWFSAFISSTSSSKKQNEMIKSLNDWISEEVYLVVPSNIDSISQIKSRVKTTDPDYFDSSPFGWHSFNAATHYQNTTGNNVVAAALVQTSSKSDEDESIISAKVPSQTSLASFEYPIEHFDTIPRHPSSHWEASIVNIFYVCNLVHDVFYYFGFDEDSGNFQMNNRGIGGKDGDPVFVFAQDPSALNNANFATPPDGRPGIMRLFLWSDNNDEKSKNHSNLRDSSFDNGIIIHEYSHGVTNRLTGGPSNSNCLSSIQAKGMGEGWSDYFALALRTLKSLDSTEKYAIGVYSSGNPMGVRAFYYSTDVQTNPLKFSSLNIFKEPHSVGTVWATILWEIHWNFIKSLGYHEISSNSLKSGLARDRGNIILFQIIMDALKLQPCNPTFLQARDAILLAGKISEPSHQKYLCLLWKGFAKRGLGSNASISPAGQFKDGFKMPKTCTQTPV